MDYSYNNCANRAKGQYFEEIIARSLEYYLEKGWASIEKTPEPMKTIENNGDGTFKAVFTKKAQPDYKGVLSGGQAIIFEAKYTDKDRIYQNVVTKEQEAYLERYASLNARCFIIVCLQGISFYRVPWNVWKGMKETFGHKYMTWTNLERYKVPRKGILHLLDGLEIFDCSENFYHLLFPYSSVN